MRKIDKLIIHCSDTPNDRDVNAATIKEWHVDGNGWSDIGYHFVIKRDGTLEEGRPVITAGAHCLGHNANSIGICLIGRDKFTKEQFQTLKQYYDDTQTQGDMYFDYIFGHYELDKNGKTCPNICCTLLALYLEA